MIKVFTWISCFHTNRSLQIAFLHFKQDIMKFQFIVTVFVRKTQDRICSQFVLDGQHLVFIIENEQDVIDVTSVQFWIFA